MAELLALRVATRFRQTVYCTLPSSVIKGPWKTSYVDTCTGTISICIYIYICICVAVAVNLGVPMN